MAYPNPFHDGYPHHLNEQGRNLFNVMRRNNGAYGQAGPTCIPFSQHPQPNAVQQETYDESEAEAQARYAAEEEAEVWTPESGARLHAARNQRNVIHEQYVLYQQKGHQQRGIQQHGIQQHGAYNYGDEHNGHQQNGHPQNGNQRYVMPNYGDQHNARAQPTPKVQVPIDLQNSLGTIRTGRCVYKIDEVLVAGGVPLRMSDGIYRVIHPSSQEFRIAKVLKVKTDIRQERARAERDILKKLSIHHSPHINHYYESYWPNGDDRCILILQYCNGGSLEDTLRHRAQYNAMFDEGFLWHTILHVCRALALCHYGLPDPLKKELQPRVWSAICHLDIKLENIFVDFKRGRGMEDDEYPTLVLGDFGCSITSDDIAQNRFSRVGQPFGTKGWFPPEYYAEEGTTTYAKRYGKSTDVWQLGAVISCMARLITKPDYGKLGIAKPCGAAYSDELNRMVGFMLREDLNLRPTVVDIVGEMKKWGKIPEDEQEIISRERLG